LQGAQWDIYAPDSDRSRISWATEKVGVPIQFHDVQVAETDGAILMASVVDHARRCVAEGDAFLALQPDHIFGEGSLAAMVAVASENARVCVAMAHPRVLPEPFLKQMPPIPMLNPMMVSVAMHNLHPTFATADHAEEEVSTWFCGVAWRKLSNNLWAVNVNSPTVFLARMTDDDVAFLSTAKPGAWDHEWPATLMQDQRQRLIGSSDAAFTVELTSATTHRPTLRQKPPGAPYTYRHDRGHNRVNQNTVVIWRGLPSALKGAK
jgi:hypothetical protein